ncbi:hypothetical protein V8C35DRAFT_278996 [Trichoderma chlorosporum]
MSLDAQHHASVSGGLPALGPAPRSYQAYTQPMPTPHTRPWTDGFPQVPAPVPVQPTPLGMQYMQPNVFTRQTSENALGQGQSGVAIEPDAQPHRSFGAPYYPVSPMSQFSGSLATPLQSAHMPIPPHRRPNYQSMPGIPPRASHAPFSPTYGTPPHLLDTSGLTLHTHRRSGHPRARRSGGSRSMVTEMNRNAEESAAYDVSGHRSYRVVSQMQGAVGTNSGLTPQQRNHVSAEKMNVKSARTCLQKVDIQDLPESERTCVICYNDFGVETPEGIHEEPVRLTKCKHIFGDHCLTRWLEESDICPYCRDKLDLPPKPERVVSQLFTAMMNARGQLSPESTEEMYMRLMSNYVAAEGLSGSHEPTSPERHLFHGDSDSSSYDDETASSAPSSATSAPSSAASAASAPSPARTPRRDHVRQSQWLPRPSQQRGAHLPAGQEREASRHQRYRPTHGNNSSVAANADSDSSDPSFSPLLTQRPEGATQASSTIRTANSEDRGGLPDAVDVQSQTNTLVASTVQSRIRPW